VFGLDREEVSLPVHCVDDHRRAKELELLVGLSCMAPGVLELRRVRLTLRWTQKATLLEFMAQWPDIESLRPLDQTELAKHYCSRMAAGFWARRRSG
jgi:hypothetical protein